MTMRFAATIHQGSQMLLDCKRKQLHVKHAATQQHLQHAVRSGYLRVTSIAAQPHREAAETHSSRQ